MPGARKEMEPLVREALADDPIEQLLRWYDEAKDAVPLAEAMVLATVDSDGGPDARMVLLKGIEPGGLLFHTNYESVKGRQLEADPRAAAILYWREQDRQVRVRGRVERLTAAESDEYFTTRPPGGRHAAWASPQSRPIEREELDRRFAEAQERYGEDVPRPEHWGGFRLVPERFELWQGREDRMHDRFAYAPEGGGWRIQRLAP
jgi:pyridoxamine 5'-phosphate oxidase